MCGRYGIVNKPLKDFIEAEFNYDFQPNYNCSPSQKLPVITDEQPTVIQAMRWGYLPHYETNHNKGFINARGEGIFTSKAFMKSAKERRCIVLANFFYEWSQTTPKVPYLIYCEDQPTFAFAGIYREWANKETGECFNTYAIVTTEPNKLMDMVKHHRSPVILSPDMHSVWLNKKSSQAEISEICSKPYEYTCMNAFPVSTAVNKPGNNSEDIIVPVGGKVL